MKTKIKSYELGQALYSILIRDQIGSIVEPIKKLDFPIYSRDEQDYLETEMVLFSSFVVLHTLRNRLASELFNKIFLGLSDIFYEDLQSGVDDKDQFRETILIPKYTGYNQFFDKQFENIAKAKVQDPFSLTGLAKTFYENALRREPISDEMHLMTTVLIATYIATGKAVTQIIESYEII